LEICLLSQVSTNSLPYKSHYRLALFKRKFAIFKRKSKKILEIFIGYDIIKEKSASDGRKLQRSATAYADFYRADFKSIRARLRGKQN
jgi:hypothetical protein